MPDGFTGFTERMKAEEQGAFRGTFLRTEVLYGGGRLEGTTEKSKFALTAVVNPSGFHANSDNKGL